MKKLVLLAAATAALSTSVMAEENMFYLRGDVGANFAQKQTVNTFRLKNKTSTSLSLGLGYYLMDNLRGELEYTHLFNPELKGSKAGVTAKTKANIDALFLKGHVDVAELSVAKLFVNAGLGMSQVKDKATSTVAGVSTSTNLKKKTNFAYSVGAGSGFDVADSAKLDLQYNFTDYGNAKVPARASKIKHRMHTIKAGVRFDI